MDYIIRPYQTGDEIGICEVHTASIVEICSKDYAPDVIKVWSKNQNANPQDYIRAMDKGEKFHVVDVAGKIMGFSGWVPGRICGFYMHPLITGKGLGRKLFEITEKDMLENSDTKACEIDGTLTARAFYEGMGFELVEHAIHTFNDGITQAPIVKMKKIYEKEL